MRILVLLLTALPLLSLQQEPFRLEPGEFRWIPITVRHTPTEIQCRFDVIEGKPTVHIELMTLRDFDRFNRGLPHHSLAVLPPGGEGALRRMIDVQGQYALVIVNHKAGPVDTVSFEVSTNADPVPRVVARELSAGRRLTVILISFAIFFVTVTWSGLKLVKASHSTEK